MNKDNMQKWVDALRSGEYKQVKGALTIVRANGERAHCCLGVACEVAIKNGVPVKTRQEDAFAPARPLDGDTVTYYDDQAGTLPPAVYEWFGLNFGNIDLLDGEGFWTPATVLNDNRDWDFNRIANGIEEKMRHED